jgi:glycosyltransferase involved in cell wall biosynthesis
MFRGKGNPGLRVALVAGTLVQGGAEKQLVYMARALRAAGVDVRVYSLTRGEFYDGVLARLGLPPHWFGRSGNRFRRLIALTAALREFRPHIIQATHFYTNLYAALSALLCNSLAIGCCRNDVFSEVRDVKPLGGWSLRLPPALLVNSDAAKRNAQVLGVKPEKIQVVSNVIDLDAFDRETELDGPTGHAELDQPKAEGRRPVALAIGRLVEQKRFDRFLAALARARWAVPGLKGFLVGEGPGRAVLEERACALGPLPDHLAFLGHRRDVPALLRRADILVLSSGYEGFPNVVLEAMAARVPVITTPAGDAAAVVQDGVAGYVIPFEDEEGMAASIIRLAESPGLRSRLGEAGRVRAERDYSPDGLAERLLSIYHSLSVRHRRRNFPDLLPGLGGGILTSFSAGISGSSRCPSRCPDSRCPDCGYEVRPTGFGPVSFLDVRRFL